MYNQTSVDITPTPRILRTLGEIPFQPWQCIAELIDNSIDAFLSHATDAESASEKKITVTWSKDAVALKLRSIEITDNACGMTIEQMQNAVRAGYTSNDPVGNLGLFGMGFNIATARLGEVTEIYSTREGDDEWIGLLLDFDALMRSGKFDVPVIHQKKQSKKEHGTRIIVKQLKNGIPETLSQKENDIRRILQKVYSPLLRDTDIEIYVKGKKLIPQLHCTWSEKRYVLYDKKPVSAIQNIDHTFGAAYFDLTKNRYLSNDEADEIVERQARGDTIPENIVLRSKKLHGWIGIQRYADPNDFGIDFIRNGRKILIGDKGLFSYDNPWTGMKELQYPIELGSTFGGRIVGELHVDYLVPTYQKNDFDRTDTSWLQTVEYICGVGPYYPKKRKALGLQEAVSAPLALLCNAFRRPDPGTKCLVVPNSKSKELYREFLLGKADYLDDTLWWKLAQEEDQKRHSGGPTTAVNTGETATDDIDDYLDDTPASGTTNTPNTGATSTNGTNSASGNNGNTANNGSGSNNMGVVQHQTMLEKLLAVSDVSVALTGKYQFESVAPLNVKAYQLKTGEITEKGVVKPCYFESNGIECVYVYNPRHVAFTQFPMTPKGLLLQYLAEKIKVRDAATNTDIVETYVRLAQSMMQDTRIDKAALQEKADGFFERLREKMSDALASIKHDVLECIHESVGEVEDSIKALIPDMDSIVAFQSKASEGYVVMNVVPIRTLIRLIDRYPEMVFDGKVLNTPYSAISLPDQNATLRMREEAKERIMSYLKDAARLLNSTSLSGKNEMARISISIDFLTEALN